MELSSDIISTLELFKRTATYDSLVNSANNTTLSVIYPSKIAVYGTKEIYDAYILAKSSLGVVLYLRKLMVESEDILSQIRYLNNFADYVRHEIDTVYLISNSKILKDSTYLKKLIYKLDENLSFALGTCNNIRRHASNDSSKFSYRLMSRISDGEKIFQRIEISSDNLWDSMFIESQLRGKKLISINMRTTELNSWMSSLSKFELLSEEAYKVKIGLLQETILKELK
ncbi:hypothetical protein [Chitinophaga agri]|uniref:Uncharacterized protein n=1 Tax=Chitinophaga agri TaxID=2703787 RepID=A0A6B9ZPW8_9BACT|nr:hypothetical protein [Chitinophaga agri]QHS63265.1 hypothetical protein GWR21_27870 [Chitinophaga agri]